MNTQPTLFNTGFATPPQKIERTKDRKLEAVRLAACEIYKAKFRAAFNRLPKGCLFTSDTIVDVIGMPPEVNLVGSMMHWLGKSKFAFKPELPPVKSTRKKANGREIRQWQKL